MAAGKEIANICWGAFLKKVANQTDLQLKKELAKNPLAYDAFKKGITNFSNLNIRSYLNNQLYRIEKILDTKNLTISQEEFEKNQKRLQDQQFEVKVKPIEQHEERTEVAIINTRFAYSEDLMKAADIKGERSDFVNTTTERHFSKLK